MGQRAYVNHVPVSNYGTSSVAPCFRSTSIESPIAVCNECLMIAIQDSVLAVSLMVNVLRLILLVDRLLVSQSIVDSLLQLRPQTNDFGIYTNTTSVSPSSTKRKEWPTHQRKAISASPTSPPRPSPYHTTRTDSATQPTTPCSSLSPSPLHESSA